MSNHSIFIQKEFLTVLRFYTKHGIIILHKSKLKYKVLLGIHLKICIGKLVMNLNLYHVLWWLLLYNKKWCMWHQWAKQLRKWHAYCQWSDYFDVTALRKGWHSMPCGGVKDFYTITSSFWILRKGGGVVDPIYSRNSCIISCWWWV